MLCMDIWKGTDSDTIDTYRHSWGFCLPKLNLTTIEDCQYWIEVHILMIYWYQKRSSHQPDAIPIQDCEVQGQSRHQADIIDMTDREVCKQPDAEGQLPAETFSTMTSIQGKVSVDWFQSRSDQAIDRVGTTASKDNDRKD